MLTRLNHTVRTNALPLAVASVALFYLLFSVVALVRHDDIYWFVWIGERFSELDPEGRIGYDGQFVYYLARDGLDAAPHLDVPAYRSQRILLAALAAALSFGSERLIAWNLLIINYVAIVVSAIVLGRWLQSRNLSAWYLLTYCLYVGTFMAYSRDLTEPLAYALLAIGMVAWLDDRPWQAAVWFALGSLTKEQVLLFPIAIGIAMVVQWQPVRALIVALSAVPLLIWEIILFLRFDALAVGQASSLQPIPLYGILSILNSDPARISGLLFVALPAVALFVLAAVYLIRDRTQTVMWILLLHALFAVFLPPDVYDHLMHAGRNAGGLVLATLFAFPLLQPTLRPLFAALWIAPTAIWLLPVLRWAPWLSQI